MILPRKPESTIANTIHAADTYLSGYDLVYGHGTATRQDDAAWLVLEAAGLSPLLEPDYDLVLSDAAIERAEDYLRQRAEKRVPAAYIVGRMWFAGLEFNADSRALIPRSPLAEFLTEDCFGLVDTSSIRRVLDLCTGGACIAIASAVNYPQAMVDAVDISPEALELAASNVAKHELAERVRLACGDLFEASSGPYDLIISNPPYVDQLAIDDMGQEFMHEPIVGLAAGSDGLDIVHRILRESAARLTDAGVLVCEVGDSAAALQAAYPDVPFQWLEFNEGGEGVFLLSKNDLSALS